MVGFSQAGQLGLAEWLLTRLGLEDGFWLGLEESIWLGLEDGF